jgi:predicted AAA+ superfamily ATPase
VIGDADSSLVIGDADSSLVIGDADRCVVHRTRIIIRVCFHLAPATPTTNVGIAHYLALLEEAFLIAPVPKYARRNARRRAAPPKLVTLNNALVAVMDPQGIADPKTDPKRFGAWVENACLAHAWNAGQNVSYWREEPLEVDAIFEGSWGNWAVEVKTGRFQTSDLNGLLELTGRHPELRPLVICDDIGRATAERAGIESISWRDFLVGPPPKPR